MATSVCTSMLFLLAIASCCFLLNSAVLRSAARPVESFSTFSSSSSSDAALASRAEGNGRRESRRRDTEEPFLATSARPSALNTEHFDPLIQRTPVLSSSPSDVAMVSVAEGNDSGESQRRDAEELFIATTARPSEEALTQAVDPVVHRRSLLPGGKYIRDLKSELESHVVLIQSHSNGVGTGILLKKNFVLTAQSVVRTFLDPFEFTIQLGEKVSNGLLVFVHPDEDLAVIKIHPPMENTGKFPSSASPRGFFWPISQQVPKPNSTVKLFGYGATASSVSTSAGFLTSQLISISPLPPKHPSILSTSSPVLIGAGDVGGPVFTTGNSASVSAIILPSRKSGYGSLMSLDQARDWIFDSMKTTCNREEQIFSRLMVGRDSDVVVNYHCAVDRAEELRVYIYSKPSCAANWKAVIIRNAHGKVLGAAEAQGENKRGALTLAKSALKSTKVFYIELWKTKVLGLHTKMATYGPFYVDDFMDGGLHFEWCEAFSNNNISPRP